ncbi:MAG: hypothetical protein J5497_02380 [Selenomonadaceae bacterium]|nr:hypothetical protein [Selenomonadaceae bacterium]
MKPVMIFKDRFGRRWIDRNTLRIIFGISAPGVPRWYNYDTLLRSTFRKKGRADYGY